MTASKLTFFFFITLLGSVIPRSVDTVSMRNVQIDTDKTETGDVCQDCIQIFQITIDLLSNKDFQERITDTFEYFCDKIPQQMRETCHAQVQKVIPIAIGFLTGVMKPEQICKLLELCDGRDNGKMKELLLDHITKTVTMPTMKHEMSIQCTLCKYIVNKLEEMLPKERTEQAIMSLLERLCSEFPAAIQSQCNNIVEKYAKALIEMLLNETSPDLICKLLLLCGIIERPITEDPVRSDCDSCLTLAVLTRMHLGSNATKLQTASFLDYVCQMHPNAMPKCKTYTQRYGKQLGLFLGQEQEALDVCKKANMCVIGDSEPVTHGDPCTLGISYRCKDLQTAIDCGAVSFCQKNVWA
ncbi:prosaposin [Misgurnus anguillicaudatus]|uniref:prosaposin n=1 Tax=Misgurnus anguillicaudatus TaxID=75329 RepID=UPI003CCF2FD3